jgi:Ca2+-dependent lipid-binding protein
LTIHAEQIYTIAGKLKVLPAVNMTPVMAVRVRTVQMSAIMRVSLSPVLDDLPFIGGVALSFMTQPYLDFDLRCTAGQLDATCQAALVAACGHGRPRGLYKGSI